MKLLVVSTASIRNVSVSIIKLEITLSIKFHKPFNLLVLNLRQIFIHERKILYTRYHGCVCCF